jgi:hypothetical protein
VPTGGYRCSASDSACPAGQHCSCGLCVKSDSEAACSFSVDVGATAVKEYEPFAITVTALQADAQTAAAGFNDTVDLSFLLSDGTRWADVNPAQLSLASGKATTMVTVNRETIPPQAPKLTASFAGNSGASAGISVVPRPFTKQPNAIADIPYGWANFNVSSPSVLPDGDKLRMYFVGYTTMMTNGVGVAFSSDGGRTFQPNSSPVFPAPGSLFSGILVDATAFKNGDTWSLAVHPGMTAAAGASPFGDIFLATSSDGVTPFGLANGGNAILTRSACPYCDAMVWFPSFVQDGSEQLMYFGAGHCNKPGGCTGLDGVGLSVGRARSTDGLTFTPEPAAVLTGEEGGEAYLATPVVILDGSVFKMFYAFSRNLAMGDPCTSASPVELGYATSTDGLYWVRSPSNPILTAGGGGWDKTGLMIGSVIPFDFKDPASGWILFYSDFRATLFGCIPAGVGRAATQ